MVKKNGYRGNGSCGKNEDGMRSSVSSVRPSRDPSGAQYLPICSYYRHFGVILDEEVCQSRGCRHYNQFYLGSGDNVRPFSVEKESELIEISSS